MYAHRIQLTNYGPIDHLDIKFPFGGEDKPKPVVLVGENGSGKSILLSHIANGLVVAKNNAYPSSPEIDAGTTFKVRSGSYIKSGCEAYFARVDFSNGMYISEILASREKRAYDGVPSGLTVPEAVSLWNKVEPHKGDGLSVSLPRSLLAPSSTNDGRYSGLFTSRCILYFPANRFDEPGWLNPIESNTEARFSLGHMLMDGATTRKVVVSSMLSALREWLLDVALDAAIRGADQSGATQVIPAAHEVVGAVLGRDDAEIQMGNRGYRLIGVSFPGLQRAINLDHLSSGETALIGLFLSIIRDYDLCERVRVIIPEIRGIVVVDEIDLHLHVRHQYDVLPRLIQMFPMVQFIVTTHSPLFVLGMANTFGDDGFDIYRLPDGQKINAEEFSEFGIAYQALADTRRHAGELRTAIEQATGPVVRFEGPTDVRYIQRAAELLGRTALFDGVDVQHTNGAGNLRKAWHGLDESLAERIGSKVVLVADCDTDLHDANRRMLLLRKVPKIDANPVKRGIENLFTKETLEKARADGEFFKEALVRTPLRAGKVDPEEEWIIDPARKTDLCDWLCANGDERDFQHFEAVFEILDGALKQAVDD